MVEKTQANPTASGGILPAMTPYTVAVGLVTQHMTDPEKYGINGLNLQSYANIGAADVYVPGPFVMLYAQMHNLPGMQYMRPPA